MCVPNLRSKDPWQWAGSVCVSTQSGVSKLKTTQSGVSKLRTKDHLAQVVIPTGTDCFDTVYRIYPPKLVTADESVEFCEATPIGLVDEPKISLYGRETDQDRRSACRCVAKFFFFFFFFLRTSSVGGGGGMLPDLLFCSFFPVQQTASGIGHRI